MVPDIGTYVEADHPLTTANPDKVFPVHEVKCSGGRWYARGEKTMWFGVGLLKTAELKDVLAAEAGAINN